MVELQLDGSQIAWVALLGAAICSAMFAAACAAFMYLARKQLGIKRGSAELAEALFACVQAAFSGAVWGGAVSGTVYVLTGSVGQAVLAASVVAPLYIAGGLIIIGALCVVVYLCVLVARELITGRPAINTRDGEPDA
jgi:uncharacterized membrane protein YbhN (UPF0104 family)